MFTAFLLVREARRAGIDVACCLDSAPARQGTRVFGVPVLPHEALDRLGPVDCVVLSSERDHEAGIRALLQPIVNPGLPMPSWKDLARESGRLRPDPEA
jgi:hypothetical protein